jgi:flagellar biosynthetic protein FliQ
VDAREAIDIINKMFLVCLEVLTPILSVGLIIGLTVALFQSVTQIQEMTLTFIPKMLAMVITLAYTISWMMNKVMDFTYEVFELIIPP